MIHFIYHIAGRKVGCTKDMNYRKSLYKQMEGVVPKIEILEELHDKTDQEAGDMEWQWADKLGYKRDTHYTVTMKAVSSRGRSGALARLALPESELDDQASRRRDKLMSNFSFEERSSWAKKASVNKEASKRGGLKGGRTTAALGKTAWQQKAECPNCGLVGGLAIMMRWHFDNCRFKNSDVDVENV
jgi:hypothetical protein